MKVNPLAGYYMIEVRTLDIWEDSRQKSILRVQKAQTTKELAANPRGGQCTHCIMVQNLIAVPKKTT
ncbi:hypothetical protein EVAR_3897_1 [Eumeta japonica]|uniref:Uncharacterized protein n=1 Tax=Eumeta variegata TaxID=151549 RepID=A0A4C1STE8_EUMVA|nr:hypothetical protein EVAR_3897_1 [Eumeta japonica]